MGLFMVFLRSSLCQDSCYSNCLERKYCLSVRCSVHVEIICTLRIALNNALYTCISASEVRIGLAPENPSSQQPRHGQRHRPGWSVCVERLHPILVRQK